MVSLKNVDENGGKKWQMVSSGDKIKHHSYRYGKHCSPCICEKKEEKEMHEEVLSKVSNDSGQARKEYDHILYIDLGVHSWVLKDVSA